MIPFHRWLSKYTIHLQFMITHELWNSIFLIFKTTLVMAHAPRGVIVVHCVQGWIFGLPLIKRNRGLGSDSLLRQSAGVSGVRNPRARGPVLGVLHPGSGMHPDSRNPGMLFITNDYASFHLWWKGNLPNHWKLSNIMNMIVWNLY